MIKKRVFIIHGWDGDVKKNWFPWLKKKLEHEGFIVAMPQMPKSAEPKISTWVNHIKKIVKHIDENTYFIGHSIGCQAILRYLETLKPGRKIGGAIFIAGWFELKGYAYKENPEFESLVRKIAAPWIINSIDFSKIKRYFDSNIVYIGSDNDYYIDKKNSSVFKKELGVKIIIEHGKGHYAERDNVKKMDIVVKELMRISN